jgi:dCMP deaminase
VTIDEITVHLADRYQRFSQKQKQPPKVERDPFARIWMDWAHRLAEGRSTCTRLKVGAVIVSADNVPLVAGYNGSPPGQPHCTDVGCLLDDQGRCKRCIHAERNAVNHAARHGIRLDGATMFVTDQPCPECVVSLTTTGLAGIVYDRAYPHPEAIRDGLAEIVAASGMDVRTLREELHRD